MEFPACSSPAAVTVFLCTGGEGDTGLTAPTPAVPEEGSMPEGSSAGQRQPSCSHSSLPAVTAAFLQPHLQPSCSSSLPTTSDMLSVPCDMWRSDYPDSLHARGAVGSYSFWFCVEHLQEGLTHSRTAWVGNPGKSSFSQTSE